MYYFTILEFWPTRLLENSLTKENVSPSYESEYPWDRNLTIRPFPNSAINKQMVWKKLIKVFIWCDEKWHQEVEYQKSDFYFQSGIRRLRFGGTEMVLGVRKWFGGTEMVFNDYKSQPPDATFHYFDIVVGNAYWVFSLIWSYVL